jgi:PncC family amidohydrolase
MTADDPLGRAREVARAVHTRLRERSATLAVAESLTGGLLAVVLTDVAGASTTFRGGVVAYATPLKASLLGVPGDLLAARGAVDADVALAMADGVADRLGATYGLATTGVAGPDPQDGKPVGTVYVAYSWRDGAAPPSRQRVRLHRFAGERGAIRVAATAAALDLLAAALASGAGPGGAD